MIRAVLVTALLLFTAGCAPSQEQLHLIVRREQQARACNAERVDQTSCMSRQVTWFKCGAPDPSLPSTCLKDGNETRPECEQWAAYKYQAGQQAAIGNASSSVDSVIITSH